jgi:hypothetical protein
MGGAQASEIFEEISIAMREHDVPTPDALPSTEAH